MLCATMICFTACKKNLEEEFVNKINEEGISSEAGVPFLNELTLQPAHADAGVFTCITIIAN